MSAFDWQEWADAISKAEESESDGWYTTKELIALTGIPDRRLREHLRDGMKAGTVLCKRVPRTNLAGVLYPVPCYRILKGKGKSSK